MLLRQLSLRPFRNFAHIDLEFALGGAIIVGANGRGKSNILEAICYQSIGKSIRGSRDHEAIPHGGAHFDIRGNWQEGDRERPCRVFYGTTEGKKVFLDETALTRVSDLVAHFQTVHFAPQDVALVLQFSAQRRRLLDIVLSQADTDYLKALQTYQRLLTQRNHYLRSLGHRSIDTTEAEVWDAQLARPGSYLRHQRLSGLVEMLPDFQRHYKMFSTGEEAASLLYADAPLPPSSEQVPSQEQLEQEFRQQLSDAHEKERHAGHTLSGPHRDSFVFTIDDAAADTYGSQGQQKSVLLSWKMAELQLLERRRNRQPLLLLDDVFSELDPVRSAHLIDMIADFDQVILTAPRQPQEALGDRYARIDLE
ncbi:MAG: DNA replication/repair protein RecF [Gemmatimonadetes bacterium]|nr:DNA replication/repair protein RecF [Gemmatimonadota bacterium]MBT5056841.1 DNA replication/repair protein RecF [Gemmatimonadota bacterium]MBT5143550.1 DNA replication/repair protein RecF [Gemmatimonadota bacterium]MBT5590241.1 DNA replication/repair protein RecF [Gemmatimonadota bacterium]MBT5963704.1 DNA replication/repair protein RecF [Gemmatimonadota bacterium]